MRKLGRAHLGVRDRPARLLPVTWGHTHLSGAAGGEEDWGDSVWRTAREWGSSASWEPGRCVSGLGTEATPAVTQVAPCHFHSAAFPLFRTARKDDWSEGRKKSGSPSHQECRDERTRFQGVATHLLPAPQRSLDPNGSEITSPNVPSMHHVNCAEKKESTPPHPTPL